MTYLQGTGQQGAVGIRSVQELQNLTGQSNKTITNNTKPFYRNGWIGKGAKD